MCKANNFDTKSNKGEMIAGKYIMDIVYSEVRGKTGRKILKIYFSLSVSRVSRALSLLLYTHKVCTRYILSSTRSGIYVRPTEHTFR